ncbi:MAG: TIGR02281 family clan AA aspartic protease [Proteobacteria bacterium]|nr:TIGR02281 family clan AA aspartic protease [Pseudomonadota bacterium]
MSAAILSAFLAGAGVLAFRAATHSGGAMPFPSRAEAAVPPAEIHASTQAVAHHAGNAEVMKAADGHYWAEATVNGRHVRFLVDTGATAVALTLDDARRLSIDPARLNFDRSVSTASGKSRAAVVELDYVSVAGARVEHVPALVLEQGLETSLLGMTYLGRLSKFEATQSALILRP